MNTTALSMYAGFGVITSAALPVLATTRGLSLSDPTHRRAGHALRAIARVVVGVTRAWDFGVVGSPPADIGLRPYVVVANHASLADPFLLSYLPFDMRFVAKRELFRVPLVGWLLGLAGDIALDRKDKASAQRMSASCAQTLARGLSVMIFPEGTRSHDGALGPFRDGAFRIAIDSHAPILPVALHGTAGCVGKDGPRRARARAEILAPIETKDLARTDVAALRERVRDSIGGALARPRHVVTDYFLDSPVDLPLG
jgi:1-acyl-sn-glycerol-3-phosphate acyltransferase